MKQHFAFRVLAVSAWTPALLALPACALQPRALDLDGDGFYQTDCDDTNDDVNPEATETCDGLDNNCDGTVDEAGCNFLTAEEDMRVTITGEDGLGPGMAAGEFDGDGFGDVVVEARLGDAPAVCVIAGARLQAGTAGAVGDTADLAEVASCWVSQGNLVGMAVSSAAAFGQPTMDIAWVLSVDDGLCAVDPFGSGFTLEQAAYGCSGAQLWATLGETPDQIVSFGPADAATATLMASTPRGIGFASPATLEADPEGFWELFTATPLTAIAGGEDLDGDGIGDAVAANCTGLWVISSDFGISVPIEVGSSWHESRNADRPCPGSASLPGDLDGDGVQDFGLSTDTAEELWSGGAWYNTIYAVENVTSAGDFNGDGEADLAIHHRFSTSIGIFLSPIEANANAAIAPVDVTGTTGTFGSGLASIDVDADGRTDLWIADPGLGEATGDGGPAAVRGALYLLSGFPIDAQAAG